MRPFALVFDSRDFASRTVERDAVLLVQALLAQPAVEALDEGVLDGFPLDETRRAARGPVIQYGPFNSGLAPESALSAVRAAAQSSTVFTRSR